MLRDERSVLPVTTLLDDYLGISDVCLSVPTVVEARGAVQRLVVPLSDGELELLRASADSIRATARRLGL